MIWACLTIARFGLADYVSLATAERLDAWAAEQRPLPPEAFAAVETMIGRAIGLAPEAARHYETQAAMYFTRAEDPARDALEKEADYKTAAELYRKAAARSRLSGYAWGNYMLAKHRAGENDAEFLDALLRASRLAPFEPDVQIMVIEAGLWSWDVLPPGARQAVARTVRNGWATNRMRILAEAAAAAPQRRHWCNLSDVAVGDDLAAMQRLCAVASPAAPNPGTQGQKRRP